ncbi:hypothetical protein [Myxococcus sp. RHSTA-1-4]|uniref:hypothetical protein n=1 Tax=Myxococcus sp. RHSTA-1-4 TaxID=2874601 RepID=UPI001CC0B0C4|nr:hypothetical protein [Myxococcus sp. RHSTA-1-4]MBZ4422009.1 hypothetical protein [Myxococcus sp. RHSTA-1-4]
MSRKPHRPVHQDGATQSPSTPTRANPLEHDAPCTCGHSPAWHSPTWPGSSKCTHNTCPCERYRPATGQQAPNRAALAVVRFAALRAAIAHERQAALMCLPGARPDLPEDLCRSLTACHGAVERVGQTMASYAAWPRSFVAAVGHAIRAALELLPDGAAVGVSQDLRDALRGTRDALSRAGTLLATEGAAILDGLTGAHPDLSTAAHLGDAVKARTRKASPPPTSHPLAVPSFPDVPAGLVAQLVFAERALGRALDALEHAVFEAQELPGLPPDVGPLAERLAALTTKVNRLRRETLAEALTLAPLERAGFFRSSVAEEAIAETLGGLGDSEEAAEDGNAKPAGETLAARGKGVH